MRIKIIISLLVIASMFSFVLHSKDSKVVEQKQSSQIEKQSNEKKPMQPFAMVDKNQFD